MPNKKTIFLLLLLAPGIGFIPKRGPTGPSSPATSLPCLSWSGGFPAKWVIDKGSSLRVDGSTNINRFSCEIADYCNPDTIVLNAGPDAGKQQGVTLTGTINLAVSAFDCHNSIMTAELRKTIKAASFPRLSIRFLSMSRLPDPKLLRDTLMGMVDIELAGVSKRLEIHYTTSSPDRNTIRVTGNQQMKFTDFGLVPPRKLGGMIHTSDRVDIEFHLNMKAIQ